MKHNMVYFASPFFTPEQVEREERLKARLRAAGFKVWSPKENCICPPDATTEMRDKTFHDNVQAIIESDIVFAVTDGKDMGTIWEAGFAFALKTLLKDEETGWRKKIVYFCETLNGGKFNLMLAQSGDVVIENDDAIDNLAEWLEKGQVVEYAGKIE